MTPPAQALREAPAHAPRPRRPPPRRRSGPAPRPRRPVPRARRPQRSRGAAALDRLLRGRGWVMLIAALLAGIVFLNVSVLELNRGIAATTVQATKLEQQNSTLRSRLADVGSAEAIQRAAENLGFVLPQPGDVGYVEVRPGDARRAASRLDSGAGSTSSSSSSIAPASSAPAASPVTPVAPVTGAAAAPSSAGTGTGTATPPGSAGTGAAAPAGSTGAAGVPAGSTGTASSTGTGTAAAPGPATAR